MKIEEFSSFNNTLNIGTLMMHDKIGYVIKQKTIVNTVFYAIYICNDSEEIHRLIHGGSSSDSFVFDEKNTFIKSEEYYPVSQKNRQTSLNSKMNSVKEISEKEIFTEEKKISVSASSQKIITFESKALVFSLKSLLLMKILVVLSVIFKQILIISIYNIIILVYISKEVNNMNSLITLIQLGDNGYSMSQIALISRSLDITQKNKNLSFYSISDLQAKINETLAFQQKMLSSYDS